MGTSGSTCAETPLRPPYRNRHLADALDPRSPSAGILRTPIEVLSQPSPGPGEAEGEGEEAEGPAATTAAPVRAGGLSTPRPRDPRSPTPGVVRTAFAFSVTARLSRLARQLSGVFLSEDEAEGDAVPGGRDAEDPHEAEELVGQLLDCEDEGDGDGGETPTAREGSSPPQEPDPPPVRTGTGLSGEVCRVWRASPTPAPTLSKRKPAALNVQSPGTVRTPLQPLAGGNSPQLALAHRQVSKLQSERLQDAEVLKAGGPSRIIYQDKENAYCLLGRLCPP